MDLEMHNTITVNNLTLEATEIGVKSLRFKERKTDSRENSWCSVARQELEEYLHGKRFSFDVPLDIAHLNNWQQLVLQHIAAIGYGQTITYRQLAENVGSPRAWRAVASVCANNPVPLLIPCHRVIPSSGGYGRYLGGENLKTALIGMEKQNLHQPV